MILADTSVWADHLRLAEPKLAELLRDGEILMHPFVLGEIALGHMRKRAAILGELNLLPSMHISEPEEVLLLIERYKLAGAGVGYIDAHLLASTLTTPQCLLWTRDKRLRGIAAANGVSAAIDH